VGLTIADGAMVVIDETVDPPVIVFDSTEKLFNCTDLLSGTVSLPARQAFFFESNSSNVNANINANHFLANVNADATHVLGSFSVSTSGGLQGVAGMGTFAAGGTYVHYQDYKNAPNGNTFFHPDNYAGYTFFASAGGLYLNERVFLDAGTHFSLNLTLTLLPVTFAYKLFVGTLT